MKSLYQLLQTLKEADEDTDVKIGTPTTDNDETETDNTDEGEDDDEYALDDEPDTGEDDDEYALDDEPDNTSNTDEPDGEDDGDSDEPDGDDSGEDGDASGEDVDDSGEDGDEPDEDNLNPNNRLTDIEDKIYQDLSDEEKISRVMELKANTTQVYSNCSEIVDQLNNIRKTTINSEVIEDLINSINNMKKYTLDYITNVYDNKTYSENKVWYSQACGFMDGIRKILYELEREQTKQNKESK